MQTIRKLAFSRAIRRLNRKPPSAVCGEAKPEPSADRLTCSAPTPAARTRAAYLSFCFAAVSDERFIAGYVQAALEFNVEYTPVVGGVPSLFLGGAAFPGNDWTVDTRGEDYLSRIPPQSHPALGKIRAFHLRATREVLRRLGHHDNRWDGDVVSFSCDNSQRT
jgi:hypothetical protein